MKYERTFFVLMPHFLHPILKPFLKYDTDEKKGIRQLIQEIGGKIHTEIPTLNGIHLVSSPFNTQEFNNHLFWKNNHLNYPDIQKNNPTLLYYSDNEI